VVPRRPRQLEGTISDVIREDLGCHPDLVLWRQNTGEAEFWDARTARAMRVRYGLCPGSSDIVGILKPKGRFIAFEVKRPGEDATPEQLAFLNVVRMHGGFGAVVHSKEEARAAVARAQAGASE